MDNPILLAQRTIFLVLSLMMCSGCGVSSFKAQNWISNDTQDLSSELYRSNNLDLCRHQAQQSESAININQNTSNDVGMVSANRYSNINKSVLTSCMESKGYKLRELNEMEIFINTVTAPFEFPLSLIGRNFEDIY